MIISVIVPAPAPVRRKDPSSELLIRKNREPATGRL